MARIFKYICLNTSCGHVELTTFAPQASKKCPKCGGSMKRVAG